MDAVDGERRAKLVWGRAPHFGWLRQSTTRCTAHYCTRSEASLALLTCRMYTEEKNRQLDAMQIRFLG